MLDNEQLPLEVQSKDLTSKLERLRREGSRATRLGKDMVAGKHVSSFGGARPYTVRQSAFSKLAQVRSSSWNLFGQLKPGFAARPGSFKAVIESSKLADRAASKSARTESKLVAQRVDAFVASEASVGVAREVSASVPPSSIHKLVALPLSSHHELVDASRFDAARCEDCLAWIAHNPSLTNVGNALETRFRAVHELITHETDCGAPAIADIPDVPVPGAAAQKFEARCNTYGKCLCKGDGLVTWRFRNI